MRHFNGKRLHKLQFHRVQDLDQLIRRTGLILQARKLVKKMPVDHPDDRIFVRDLLVDSLAQLAEWYSHYASEYLHDKTAN